MISTSKSSAPLVLIADDQPNIIRNWTTGLAGYGIEVVAATSLEELDVVFDRHKHEIVAVILDGCMPGDSVNTIGFIKAVRADGFRKPIVASSSLREYRSEMVRAGCSHQAPKETAPDLVADLLSAP